MAARPFSVMLKPVGASCNLACGYCYYRDKPTGWMTEATLDLATRQVLEAHPGRELEMGWHGGEPTLRGLPFYRRAVAMQMRLARGRRVRNVLQTNGTRIDAEWAAFLAQAQFLVGLSIDGPPALHDAARGGGHPEAVAALRLLRRYQVDTNVLCVVGPHNVDAPVAVYEHLVGLGAVALQFIPAHAPASIDAHEYGRFMVAILDRWRRDIGRVFVQDIEVALQSRLGLPASRCINRERCGDQLVIEADGTVYACDHAVDEAHRLGRLGDDRLVDLLDHPALRALGDDKARLATACRRCRFVASCHGACPLRRETATGVAALCKGYRAFYGAFS
ncbi:MAG: radical SAM protein [Deltaproteobacteria bacterium]|nr:radical SAM protein [Deltaproteobacteria bacterium]